jgi:hypothetical protein
MANASGEFLKGGFLGNRQSGQGLAIEQTPETPRTDGISSCLSRINNLLAALNETTDAFSGIADKLGGKASLNESVVQDGSMTVPDNALFHARQIETSLETIVGLQEDSINRIRTAIS